MNGILEIILLYFFFWTCGMVFCYPMEKKKHFRRNSIIMLLGILIFLAVSLYFMPDRLFVTEILIKNIMNVGLFFWIILCWDIPATTALYNTIWSIALWQLLYEVWIVIKLICNNVFSQDIILFYGVMILLFVVSHVVCALTIAKWMPNDRKKKLGPRQTLSAVLIFSIIEMLSYAPALRDMYTYNEDWKFIYLSQMMCIIILYMQNELFKTSDIKQELDIMNLLWKKEQEQYKLNKENIALINQKSHDLKHQIKALRKASKEEYDKYLDEMEESVLIYNAIVKTGNEVFDTILTEKSLYCKDRGIQVSCVADGSQMDFINTVDLYAILGNAMDNAIEAVEKFQEIEKRQIDVMIYRQQNFLVMNIINPVAEKIEFDEEDLPVTTKEDKKYHGFGMRSMRHIVRKYDGHMNVTEEDGCFSLKMLIPIPS